MVIQWPNDSNKLNLENTPLAQTPLALGGNEWGGDAWLSRATAAAVVSGAARRGAWGGEREGLVGGRVEIQIGVGI